MVLPDCNIDNLYGKTGESGKYADDGQIFFLFLQRTILENSGKKCGKKDCGHCNYYDKETFIHEIIHEWNYSEEIFAGQSIFLSRLR